MRAAATLLVVVLAWGCRAQVDPPKDLGGDLSADMGEDLAPPEDLLGADLYCSTTEHVETCGNGCDDDKNGHADEDDPACTPQVLATAQAVSSQITRLVFGAQLKAEPISGETITGAGSATYARGFTRAAFYAVDTVTRELHRVPLPDGGITTHTAGAWTTVRDVCVFNGELIVVERAPASKLHRFQADGTTEIMPPVDLGMIMATACASDGEQLYVAVHDTVPNPSQFLVFDKNLVAQPGAIALPPALVAAGLTRCLDLAFSKADGAFYGLFVDPFGFPSTTPVNDSAMSARQIYPFAFDGGVSAPIDGGVLHGLGEYLP